MMNFTEREKELLSLGLLALMQQSHNAFETVHSDKARDAINEYFKELKALNDKVCEVS